MARKCELCNSGRSRLFEKDMYNIGKKKFDLVKCKNCGFVFVDPLPNAKQRKEMYSKDYFDTNKMSGTREKGYMEDQEYYEKEFTRMLKTLRRYKIKGKLLDIGCAAGFFMNLARKHGYDVGGVEISKWASDFARKKFKLKVFNGELEQAKFKDSSFDVVVALNVLEHVENPNKFLMEIRRILKKEGVLIIDIPSYVNSPYYGIVKRISWIYSREKDVQKMFKMDEDKAPYHLYEYSPKNLKRMLKKHNFTVLKTEADVPYPEVIFGKNGFKYGVMQACFIFANLIAKNLNIKFNHTIAYFRK